MPRSRESWLVRHLWFQEMELQATEGPFPTCPLERNECKTSSFGIHRAALPPVPYLLPPTSCPLPPVPTSCPYLLSPTSCLLPAGPYLLSLPAGPTCWPYLLTLTCRHLSSDPYVLAAGLLHKRRLRKQHVCCGFQSGHQFS